MNLELSDWLGVYGAALSTTIAVVAAVHYFTKDLREKRERKKVHASLYWLHKEHPERPGEKFPMVAILVANLGNAKISIKGVNYSRSGDTALACSGSPGWYEEPEAAYGRGRRILPVVLDPGETVDLPLFIPSFFEDISDLRLWLNTFDDERIDLEKSELEKISSDVNKS